MTAIALLALLLQDEDSPNLQAPLEVPPAAVEADREGWELIEEYRREPRDVEMVERAIKKFIEAERLNGNKAFALAAYHLGIAYQHTEQYKEAKRRLERAVELNPKFHEALLELGDTHLWLKQYEAAVKAYDRALALNAGFAPALRNKGMALMRLNDFPGAHRAVSQAVGIDPEDEFAWQLKQIADKEVEGPGFRKEFRKESSHFVVTTDVDDEYAAWIARHVELIYAKYETIFPKLGKPKHKHRVIVFKTSKDYFDYGSPKGTGGYYQDLTKKLVFWKQPKDEDTLLVLYHETFHQFLAFYLDHAPQWFNEGHGDYFGPSRYDEKTRQMQIRTNPWRLGTIQQAIRANNTLPLPVIMRMTQQQLYDPRRVGINYAQSWALVHFLWHFDNGRHAKLLQDYFRVLMKDEDLREAYEAVFAKVDMAKMEEDWKAYTLGLKAD